MKRLNVTQKIEALQNAMVSFNFPKKYFIQLADKRCGEKFALASKSGDLGGIAIHSEFIDYAQFNAYLKGWYDAKTNKF